MGAKPDRIRCTTRIEFPEELQIKRGKKRSKTYPVIIPPVKNKVAVMPAGIQKQWEEARSILQNADEVVFFGYSCPGGDTEAEGLFRRTLGPSAWNGEAVIVNPDAGVLGRIADFFPGRPVRYYRSTNDWLS